MLRIAHHTADDIQWFVWREGSLLIQEGDNMVTLASNVRELQGAEQIIRAYMAGRADAATSNQKTNPSRA